MENSDTNQPCPSLSTSEAKLLEQLRANPLMAEKFKLIINKERDGINKERDGEFY